MVLRGVLINAKKSLRFSQRAGLYYVIKTKVIEYS